MSDTVRPDDGGARPLELAPFQALRYNAAALPDLGAVTCPPYDVINAHGVERFEAADPHNVVRLILPRGGDRYARAADELQRWQSDGILVQDDAPSLYVYELTSGADAAVGLVGAVSLHDSNERRVLPHEDVFSGPVADRVALMDATSAQLEPILLTYEGDGPASDVVDATLRTPSLLEVRTPDDAVHRIWRITDPDSLARISADLGNRQALIADGHHRYAAYLKMRESHRHSHGLAMVVDAHRHPLRLGAIHRSVDGLTWEDALASARRGFHRVEVIDGLGEPSQAALGMAGSAGGGPAITLTDGRELALLADPDPALVAATMPEGRSEQWQQLAASLACEFVLAGLWGIADSDRRVAYHHRAADAVSRAHDGVGVAIVLQPARQSDVMALAARGERMPRKSTSFGPKPRTGFLMRLLTE